jgi:hypothetical protein
MSSKTLSASPPLAPWMVDRRHPWLLRQLHATAQQGDQVLFLVVRNLGENLMPNGIGQETMLFFQLINGVQAVGVPCFECL